MFSLLLGYFSNMLNMVDKGNRYGITRGSVTIWDRYGLTRGSVTRVKVMIAKVSNLGYWSKQE